MRSVVVLARSENYKTDSVRSSLRKILDPLGGMGKFVNAGDRVLLKPNLLTSAHPDSAVTTHPEIVRAVAMEVIDFGGKPFIADSPAIKGFDKVAKSSGLKDVADELNIPIKPLDDSVSRTLAKDNIFRMLELSRDALEADVVINLPKLKTHSMMLMTMAVKNLFGCVVGTRKAQWHLKAGENKLYFARLLLEIYRAISPALNIMDGIVGMEGDGPGSSGTPIKTNLLAASTDGIALDRVMLEVAGVDPDRLYTNVIAREMGIGETDLARIKLEGDPLSSFKTRKFKMPKGIDTPAVPPFVMRLASRHFVSRPVEDVKTCTLCEECIEICPTGTISNSGERLSFDYDKCIRCYCCVEVCPEGSMKPFEPVLSRLLG